MPLVKLFKDLSFFSKNKSVNNINDFNDNFLIKPEELDIEEERFAKGSYGSLYKATYRDQLVAIKYMHYHEANISECIHELEMLKAVSNTSYSIKLSGYFKTKTEFCLITEYVPKGSIFDLIKKSYFATDHQWQLRSSIAYHLACGIKELHDLNIIHRDIKSLNILVTHDYSIKICDFGFAIAIDNDNSIVHSEFVGTFQWQAPETFLEKEFSKATDIYSTGVILWELATGKQPMQDKKYDEVFTCVTSSDLREPIPNECPKYMATSIINCFHFYKDQRPTANKLMTDLVPNIKP